jgi:universal stress protein A
MGLLKGKVMLAIKTILHPTDFSATSAHAFQLACSLARDHGGRVIVLHVAVPPVAGYRAIGEPSTGEWKELEEQLKQIHADDLKVPVEHILEQGDPAAEIIRVAQEIKSDMIVMGTHGRSPLRRLLMGSVAEQVVRKASCPVLTVRGAVDELPKSA